MPYKVSTIVPVYNGSQWLPSTLDSLLAQSYPHHEIVLVDDGSTDDSAAFIGDMAERHAGKVSAVFQQNAGVGAARNAGILAASGDLVALCDQDDLWLPDKLERQLPLFSERVGLVYSGVEIRHPERSRRAVPRGEPATLAGTLRRNRISSCTAVTRRSLIERVGMLEPDRALMGVDDWHLWVRLLAVTEAAYVPDVLAVHRVHGTNYSSREKAMLDASIACLDRLAVDPLVRDRRSDLLDARLAVYRHYSRNFIHYGQFPEARDCIGQQLRLRPLDPRAAATLLALSLLPGSLLSTLQRTRRKYGTP